MAAQGPYSAQIQRAINGLLAGDNTWTGTNTFTGTVVIGSLSVTTVLAGNGTAAAPSYSFASETNSGRYRAGSGDLRESIAGSDVFRFVADAAVITANNYLGWGSSGVTSADVKLYREAPNSLSLKNGANPQTLNIFRTTGESATLRFVGTEFQIWAEVNGASRSMALIAPSTSGISMYAGGSSAVNRIVNISSAGLMFPNDNTHDIGASGATRPKTGYFGTRVVSPEFQTTTALVALGGGAGATLGTIGGSGPATAGQNTWLRMVDSTGAAFWVPAWK